jgi:hypothetical protein
MRIHLAQFWYRPAYFEKGIDYLAEPSFDADVGTPLALLSDIQSVEKFRCDCKAAYLAHITQKLRCIAEWSVSRGGHMLIFPEYSVPAESLAVLRDLARKHELLIIAASHRVRMSPESDATYRALDIKSAITGSAVCPILLPSGNPVLAPKLSRSKWETSLAVDP